MENKFFDIDGTDYKILIVAGENPPKILKQLFYKYEKDFNNFFCEKALHFESKDLRDKFLVAFQHKEAANYLYKKEFEPFLN